MQGIVAGAILLLAFGTPFKPIHKSVAPVKKNVLAAKTTPTLTPTPNPKKPITYTVQSGETLYSIAKKFYKSELFWTNIWNSNKSLEDPRSIRSGMELVIDESNSTKPAELSPDLEKIFNEIINPTSTPTPTPDPNQASALPQGIPSNFDDVYKQAGSKFGVPWEILYGIHLTETGLRDGAIMSGYGSGAEGPMQFLPSTFNAYATDGNGDGVIDINNASDAIFTAANFIATHGGLDNALKSYGGATQAILNAAKSRGYNP